MNLQGKKTLVTGASRGIGATVAKELAAKGAFVAVNYANSADAAKEVVATIEAKGGKAIAVQADVSNKEGVKKLFGELDDPFGGELDILINNAGFFPLGTLEESSDEDFDKVVNLNIRGVLHASQEAISRMKKGGRIINIGSIFGERMPLPGIGLYTMSKFAVAGFTRAWARDLGPKGITVNCIQPGPIDTVLNPADGEFANYILPHIALGRYGTTQEVAALISFIASDEASYITGACLNIDGGANA